MEVERLLEQIVIIMTLESSIKQEIQIANYQAENIMKKSYVEAEAEIKEKSSSSLRHI